MKTVNFAKAWKHVISATSYARYPAGAGAVVEDHVAAIAHRDKVLTGEPVDAPDEPGLSPSPAVKKSAKA